MKITGKLTGKVEKAGVVERTELVFSSIYEFPAIGETDKLYIDTSSSAVYFFDGECYRCCGRNYEDVETIQSIL